MLRDQNIPAMSRLWNVFSSYKEECLKLFFLFFTGHLIDQIFYDLFFYIYIKAQHTDKSKFVKKILFFFWDLLKRIAGHGKLSGHIFCKRINLFQFQLHDFLIERSKINTPLSRKIFLGNGFQKFLNVTDRKDIFKIINKYNTKRISLT